MIKRYSLGAIILATDIIGQQRLRNLDKQIAFAIRRFKNPLSLYRSDRSGAIDISSTFATVGALIGIATGLALFFIYFDSVMQYFGFYSLWILAAMILIPAFAFIFSLVVMACISILLYLILVPVNVVIGLQKYLKLPGAIKLFGVAFLLIGFILQILASF